MPTVAAKACLADVTRDMSIIGTQVTTEHFKPIKLQCTRMHY